MSHGLTLETFPEVERDVSLASLTTYRFGGPARFYAEVENAEQLSVLLSARMNTSDRPVDLLILGRGSNLVVSDAGFDGLVIRLRGDFSTLQISDDGEVTAGGGVSLPLLARQSVRAGRGGLEWCVGIPGSVGGAVRMNAGGHSGDMATWLLAVEVFDAAALTLENRSATSLGFGYRSSNLTADHLVLNATFRTVKRDPVQGEEIVREITRWRRDHQPGGTLNAGSVFKNPPGDFAGRIIEELGLKEFRVGGAYVSPRHANFFVAERDASAQDVFDLVKAVQREVQRDTGLRLVPEVRFVGNFKNTSRGGEGDES